jgi:predicted ATPase/transcriptional regulator with XRE-family HTH domain
VLGQTNQTSERFSSQLRDLRERAGLTQEELAERAGLTPHAVSALERGARTRPYPHTVRSLADALEVTPGERSALVTSVPRRGRESAQTQSAPAPPSADAAAARHSLVVPPTRIYGRDADVREVSRLARNGASRLLTLTGPGGVGKTRLAAAVCDELVADFPGGTLQVALASLSDAGGVVASIARGLDLAGVDGPDALDRVAAHLTELRLLLVLDNFEHLLSASVHVGRLVASCPGLTVLVTSRSPLRVRGEHEYAVPPLTLPSGDVTTTEGLAASASGALVLDLARAVSPLPMGADEVRALGQLCQRLAGIPLAIELAAARLRLLSPQTLLSRLESLPSAGTRDLPERQRTMRATLDWSYRLLTPEQQTLFRLLSVFRGGATLDAVEELAARTGAVPAAGVLELLGLLVEQSLVVVRPGADAGHRYDMLEPVAQYARSLLMGEAAVLADRAHAQVYVALAERAAVGYERDDQVLWLARTEAEEANLLVAIERALDSGDATTAARITWPLWLYWWLRNQSSVGRRCAEQCLASDLLPALRARVHLTAACMSYAAGDQRASADHWAEAYRLGMQEHDPHVACAGRAGLGLAALAAGDLADAEQNFRAALPLGEEAAEAGVWLRSLIHVWLGTVLLVTGDPARAVTEIERGHRLAQGRGDRLSSYIALYNLSQAAIATGATADARRHLEKGIRLTEETRDLANLGYFLDTLAVVEAAEGATVRVAVLLGAAQSLRETAGANVYGYYLPDESLRADAERAARAALGEDSYDDAVDAGRALEPADAVRFALGLDVKDPMGTPVGRGRQVCGNCVGPVRT